MSDRCELDVSMEKLTELQLASGVLAEGVIHILVVAIPVSKPYIAFSANKIMQRDAWSIKAGKLAYKQERADRRKKADDGGIYSPHLGMRA